MHHPCRAVAVGVACVGRSHQDEVFRDLERRAKDITVALLERLDRVERSWGWPPWFRREHENGDLRSERQRAPDQHLSIDRETRAKERQVWLVVGILDELTG